MKQICLYTCMALLALVACRPARKVQKIEEAISKKDTTSTVVVTPTTEPAVDSLAIARELYQKIELGKTNFNSFQGKMKVEYEGKDGGDQATASVRVLKDSLIWISLTGALGIEGYRLLITQDSVYLMNKLNKTITLRSIDYLAELTEIPFDFETLQNLIVGNPVFTDSNVVTYRNTDNTLSLLMVGSLFKHLVTLENTSFKLLSSKLDDVDAMRNRTCVITYGDYTTAGGNQFAQHRKITVAEKSRLNITINFKNFEFNNALTFPFSIPKNYKRK
jgi:hypothetical protein